ncbi:MAG: hypothetical protein WBP45_02875 [Daejeonella sp.]
MKKLLSIALLFIGSMLMIAPAANAIAEQTNYSTETVFITIAAVAIGLSLISEKRAGFANGVEVEIWVNYIIERLWKDNMFLKYAFSDDDKVLAGKIVHIPQPGSKPTVVKNRSSFPAAAVRRTDTDIVYSLDEYSTDPTHVQDAEKVELSYDKIDSVYGDHAGVITETAGDDLIIKWLTGINASSKLLTTGGATAATAPSATGNRKLFTPADVRRAMTKFNVDNIKKQERYAAIPSNLLDQLVESLSQTQYKDFSQYMDASTGVIGKLYSFNIIDRSSVAISNSSNVVKALGAVGATTDNEVAIFWQKNAVARALGEVKFFENLNDPQYYGDVYSSLLRMGGRRRREDDKGIIMLNQDAA